MNSYQTTNVMVTTLRLFWGVVEETQSSTLLRLNDTQLVKQLVWQVTNRLLLSSEETYALSDYIHTRTTLIRDLAHSAGSQREGWASFSNAQPPLDKERCFPA